MVSAGPRPLGSSLASGIYSLHVAMEKCKVNQIPSLPWLNAPIPAPLLAYNGRAPCDRGAPPGPPPPRPGPADSLASPTRAPTCQTASGFRAFAPAVPSPRRSLPPGLCRQALRPLLPIRGPRSERLTRAARRSVVLSHPLPSDPAVRGARVSHLGSKRAPFIHGPL